MRIFMSRKLKLPDGNTITSKLIVDHDISAFGNGTIGTTAIAEYVKLNYPGWEILTTIL